MSENPQPSNATWTPEQTGQWWSEVKAADARRASYEPWWDENLKQYAPTPERDPKAFGTEINTNRDYALVEQKKAHLFFHTPEVSAKPSPLIEAMGAEAVIQTHQRILNESLGPDRVNAKAMMDRVLFDLCCTAGMGVTKMGYESVVVPVPQMQPVPDPVTGAPAVDPLTGQPVTVETTVPVPIYERTFWEHVSPRKVLIPSSFHDTAYDRAPWLGTRFRLPKATVSRFCSVPQDYDPKTSGKDQYAFDHLDDADQQTADLIEGVEIWYRACLYDQTVQHPDRLRRLVLLEGLDQPAAHEDSPYQSIDPATGGLTANSLIGYPIHIATVRVMTDAAFVPSDCTITRPQVNELNRFREQQIKMRDANVPLRVFNIDAIPAETLQAAITHTDVGDFVGLPSTAFAGENIKELARSAYPRENFAFEEKQDADIARSHALDANQAGTTNATSRTATELQLVQVNANARLEKERAALVEWYCAGVTKFSTLLQRFTTEREAAKIVGPEAASAWAQVMPAIPAALAFTARPDSAVRVDAAQERKQAIDLFSYLAKDPMVDRRQLLTGLLRKFDLDPGRILLKPEAMPKRPPDAPRIQVVVKGEDFAAPQAPVMIELLRAGGIQLSPDALKATGAMAAMVAAQAAQGGQMVTPQTEHGGLAPRMQPMRAESETQGQMQGTSHTAPIAPGGQVG